MIRFDYYSSNEISVVPDEYEAIEGVMKKVGKESQKFERLEMKKEDLLEMFKVCHMYLYVFFFFFWFNENVLQVLSIGY